MKKLFCLLIILSCLSCNVQKKFKIGVSQCSGDIWREKQNEELKMASYIYDNVALEFASADDNDKTQIAQINHFIDESVDLLIVSPNQVHAISPVIDKAYDKGIPVILFDRKTDSQKYTAFMGADNLEMGRVMGSYVISKIPTRGKILVIRGLKNSSPALERHEGFKEGFGGEERLIVRDGDWTEESGQEIMEKALQENPDIVCVCAQNDRMALGAYKVAKKSGIEKRMVFTGIDALPSEGGGIELVRDSILTASYIYPTRGDLLLQLAMNILEGTPYKKENLLKSALVTPENAEVMLVQAEEISEQNERLLTLSGKVDAYLSQYHHQQVYSLLAGIIALLVLGSSAFVFRIMHRRHQLEREAFALVVGSQPATATIKRMGNDDVNDNDNDNDNGDDNDDDNDDHGESKGTATGITEVSQEQQTMIEEDPDMDTHFLDRLRQHVQDQMIDSDFGVEALASEMGLSRVQLYRKVKQLTGHTPVDIIRMSRLNRAKALLAQGSKNVSEVAYDVGFSSPSYFTKCFKDEFGVLPGEVK